MCEAKNSQMPQMLLGRTEPHPRGQVQQQAHWDVMGTQPCHSCFLVDLHGSLQHQGWSPGLRGGRGRGTMRLGVHLGLPSCKPSP